MTIFMWDGGYALDMIYRPPGPASRPPGLSSYAYSGVDPGFLGGARGGAGGLKAECSLASQTLGTYGGARVGP